MDNEKIVDNASVQILKMPRYLAFHAADEFGILSCWTVYVRHLGLA